MAQRDRLHILVIRPAVAEAYTSFASGRGSPRPPPPIRQEHGLRLREELESATRESLARRNQTAARVGVRSTSEGMLLTFESWPGFELDPVRLDPQNQPPELLALRTSGQGEEAVELATVYVPEGSLSYFLGRIDQYVSEDTARGNPRHADLVERIAHLRLATIEELWTDDPDRFPDADLPFWWELWLRRSDGLEADRLRAYGLSADIEVGHRQLVFDNRTVILARATARQLSLALDVIDDFAELRAAHTKSEFFARLDRVEQAEWVEDLVSRSVTADSDAPVACLLDTGVNRAHPLLSHSIAEADLHACVPSWGVHDHDGHGTEMAGIALYGDLERELRSNEPVVLRQRLESVKILPPTGGNDPDLYGAITAEAVARVEVQAADRRRTFAMSVSSAADEVGGVPTSWSSVLDALASGREFDAVNGTLHYMDEADEATQRLFVVAAGNVRPPDGTYLDRSDVEPVEDPGQAWNALTVGAFTDLWDLTAAGEDFADWAPIAPAGDLSPLSRTSVAFPRQWPIKPEVVLEGGNVAISPEGEVDYPDAFQVLTTGHNPPQRLLSTANGTSAATSRAAHIAASVSAEYPSLWPETIRGLIVHSAEWTQAMRDRFSAAGPARQQREALVRRYGFGVPDLERCLRSATDALTLIVQDTIHPYEDGKLREMHLHDLPWPTESLASLGEVQVRCRVTLSYFIEPSPTRRGWKRRYRYASHLLRFELQRGDETNDDFRKRLNRRALDEEESRPVVATDTGWFLGADARNRGSLHSDIWEGTASELASRGRIAVFPVTGWWKELRSRDRSSLGARYALVVSIESPVEDVDLWTPVAQEVGLPITIET